MQRDELERPARTSRTSSKPPSRDRKDRRAHAKPGGAKVGHEGHSRRLSTEADRVIDHTPPQCPCCQLALSPDLPSEAVSVHERIELPQIRPVIEHHRRLAMQCPGCGARVVAAPPPAATGTPFGPRLHALATYLIKTGVSISQGGLMNLLRRAQDCFQAGREQAVAALRCAEVVASDETVPVSCVSELFNSGIALHPRHHRHDLRQVDLVVAAAQPLVGLAQDRMAVRAPDRPGRDHFVRQRRQRPPAARSPQAAPARASAPGFLRPVRLLAPRWRQAGVVRRLRRAAELR
ncbi:MAG: IS66 family transposase zinc-finger binding domain-containing protein, partial [Acetobacteraceae bacterium]|nr:IS66 family transposase zinc-finger binding domain-containing protein [Acetobacteraceae bacterium]